MTLIKGKGSIEEKIAHEKETRRMIRKQEDEIFGKGIYNRSKDEPRRGDYKFCKEADKILNDMRRFPKDRDRISKYYHDWMKSQRKYG